MIIGKIYFRVNKDGTKAASINLTGDVSQIKLEQKEKLWIQIDESGEILTMTPTRKIKI